MEDKSCQPSTEFFLYEFAAKKQREPCVTIFRFKDPYEDRVQESVFEVLGDQKCTQSFFPLLLLSFLCTRSPIVVSGPPHVAATKWINGTTSFNIPVFHLVLLL